MIDDWWIYLENWGNLCFRADVRTCHPNFPGPCSLPFLVSSNPDVSSERGQIGGRLPRLDTWPSIVQVQQRASLPHRGQDDYYLDDLRITISTTLTLVKKSSRLSASFFTPPHFFISRTFFLAGRSRGWVWPGCFITSPSGPCWTSVPAPSVLMWRDKYIR